MCYQVLLSTDSPVDLSARNDRLVTFSRALPGLPEEAELTYSHRWYVGSVHGCSCGFRHLYAGSVELGFGEPVEWYVEEEEDIAATLKFIETVRFLVEGGAKVECIDVWQHHEGPAQLSGTVQVNLAGLGNSEFRFFENHRFLFGQA